MIPVRAVVPMKEAALAKQRLAPVLGAAARQALALAMLEDVLAALVQVRSLAGIVVVTADAAAARIAARFGADAAAERAREGHTEAVAAAARRLAQAGEGMLTIPADVPLIEAADVERILATEGQFVIVPAHDSRGSNAVLCRPADAVPLRFGEASYAPHLAAAEARGIAPVTLRLERIALDIDGPDDLAAFLRIASRSRARAVLEHEAGTIR
jgi:2-phospho-L-lactate guanylyltransferase